MWEDVGAWNTYADSDGGSYDYSFSDPSMWSDFSYSSPSYADPDTGWGWSAPQSQPAPTYSWDQPLDYTTPQSGNESEQLYNYYKNSTGGDYGQAFQKAASDRWVGGAGESIPVRNAEHALFSQAMIQKNPIMGSIAAATGVPAYTGAKWAAQNIPGVNRITRSVIPPQLDLSQATPASWQELLWGLRPFWPYFSPARMVR